MNKYKPTLCVIPTAVWRNWTGGISNNEFIKKYVPSQNTRYGNENTIIKPIKYNKIISVTEHYKK